MELLLRRKIIAILLRDIESAAAQPHTSDVNVGGCVVALFEVIEQPLDVQPH